MEDNKKSIPRPLPLKQTIHLILRPLTSIWPLGPDIVSRTVRASIQAIWPWQRWLNLLL